MSPERLKQVQQLNSTCKAISRVLEFNYPLDESTVEDLELMRKVLNSQALAIFKQEGEAHVS